MSLEFDGFLYSFVMDFFCGFFRKDKRFYEFSFLGTNKLKSW